MDYLKKLMSQIKTYLILALLLIATKSSACSSPPDYIYSPAPELIARTSNIVLARVVGAELLADHWSVVYRFKKIKQIKGKTEAFFDFYGEKPGYQDENNSFENHTAERKPDSFDGRLFNGTDCKVHPSFDVGGVYLLFLDKPYHVKGFEYIDNSAFAYSDGKDKWLKYVEENAHRIPNKPMKDDSLDVQLYLFERGYEANDLKKRESDYESLTQLCAQYPDFQPVSETFYKKEKSPKEYVKRFYELAGGFSVQFLYERRKEFPSERGCIEKVLATIPTLDDFVE